MPLVEETAFSPFSIKGICRGHGDMSLLQGITSPEVLPAVESRAVAVQATAREDQYFGLETQN